MTADNKSTEELLEEVKENQRKYDLFSKGFVAAIERIAEELENSEQLPSTRQLHKYLNRKFDEAVKDEQE